ncbi:uncharacterized protein UDID_17567 [Ustilago sp. UG-2017a]|nr:uncharacterized protein UDID_17567 [Ustilago sp. UG-2017a]
MTPGSLEVSDTNCVSLSTVEAEFIAATEATREVLFLKQLLCSIGIATGTPTVYSDNTGCIQVSKDPAQHWKLKHIDTKYHFVRNNVQEGRVQIKYMDTTRNLADVLTKPIGRQAMQQARSGLHLQILAAVYKMGSPSYATVLKNGGVRGLAPETQVGLSRHSVTIQLCDSYCLGLGLEELVPRRLSSCTWTTAFGSIYIRTANLLWAPSDVSVASDTDLLAGLLFTAPPSTGDGSFDSYLSSP